MTGNRALVTGASHGLGGYLAAALAAEGWAVTGIGRCSEEEVASGCDFDYRQADLSVPDTLESLPGMVGQTPDLVVHCAVTYPDQAATTPALPDLQTVFLVNAIAPYLLTLNLLARKPAHSFCSCIVVNSEAIFAADQRSAGYAASKAALRVLTAGLADSCRSANASVATLLLGPLADEKKLESARSVGEKRGMSRDEVVRMFLRKSNPNLVIETFIDYESCFRSVQYIVGLGPMANGMVCRLDGGSAGSLI